MNVSRNSFNHLALCITLAGAVITTLSAQAMEPSKKVKSISLSSYKYNAASVLPIVYQFQNGTLVKCAILAQETNPRKREEFDDFGGGKNKDETHPQQTAGREFFEEAILSETLKWDLPNTIKMIGLKNGRTKNIIGHNKRVTYITLFSATEIALLKQRFHEARSKQSDPIYEEKKQLATVRWDVLEDAVRNAQKNKHVTVRATLVNPQTGIDFSEETNITLRPPFVKKLRPFLLNQEYQKGKKDAVRFYTKKQ